MTVLGVSAFFHDSAAALCVDGKIIAAAQEERFSRAKGDASFPYSAIEYCCSKLLGQKIDCVALFNDPMKVLDRWMGNLMNQSGNIIDLLDDDNINYWQSSAESLFGQKLWTHAFVNDYFRQRPKFGSPYVCAVPHHLAHAASAFYPSPYDEAAIMVVDGVGEWAATTLGSGIGRKIDFLEQQDYPHSLGLFYSAMTQFCGFDVNFGEYKLMGLAPYGRPVWFEKLLEDVVDVKQDGSLRLDMNYFAFEKEAHKLSTVLVAPFRFVMKLVCWPFTAIRSLFKKSSRGGASARTGSSGSNTKAEMTMKGRPVALCCFEDSVTQGVVEKLLLSMSKNPGGVHVDVVNAVDPTSKYNGQLGNGNIVCRIKRGVLGRASSIFLLTDTGKRCNLLRKNADIVMLFVARGVAIELATLSCSKADASNWLFQLGDRMAEIRQCGLMECTIMVLPGSENMPEAFGDGEREAEDFLSRADLSDMLSRLFRHVSYKYLTLEGAVGFLLK